jgi:hypothetical protein
VKSSKIVKITKKEQKTLYRALGVVIALEGVVMLLLSPTCPGFIPGATYMLMGIYVLVTIDNNTKKRKPRKNRNGHISMHPGDLNDKLPTL